MVHATITSSDDYGISTSVEPLFEPVSLPAMKNWLRVDHDEDDSLIGCSITSVREQVESLTRRSLINQTLVQTQADFPWWSSTQLTLRASPVSSVSSITYADASGDSQTLSSANYRVVTDRIRPFVRLKTGFDWPVVEDDNDTAVTITMIAGYGASSETVPSNILTAIKMGVAYDYENRGDGRPIVRLTQVERVIRRALGPAMIVEF